MEIKKMVQKHGILILIIIVFTSIAGADDSYLEIDIDIDNNFYKRINENYDSLKLKYIIGNIEFESYGRIYFSIEKINYYGFKNNVCFFLGYADKTGVYDKDLRLLKKCPFTNTDSRVNIGLSSLMLKYPFEPSIIIKNIQRNTYSNTDQYAFLEIDIIKNTLVIFEPNIEF
jgi:hypothetical protein